LSSATIGGIVASRSRPTLWEWEISMQIYCAELITRDGRRFLLAGYGWSYADHCSPYVRTFPTRADAYRAARKGLEGARRHSAVAPAPEWVTPAP
jgi:hypothetical protein